MVEEEDADDADDADDENWTEVPGVRRDGRFIPSFPFPLLPALAVMGLGRVSPFIAFKIGVWTGVEVGGV